MKSCVGAILEVDLTTQSIKKTAIPEEVYRNVLAGKGLGVWYCLRNIPAGADPLGPDNVLGFTSGALTGSGAFFCGRSTVVGKSSLTGGWGDSNVGGVFSPAIKQCGVDAIFFRGISEKPVYLYMDNTTCQLRDAEKYWGLDATEAELQLKEECRGKKEPCVAVIGQGGEKLSCISGICNEGGRIAARSGLGAVMGSKKLKAVVLAGSKPLPCADFQRMRELNKPLAQVVKNANLPKFVRGSMLGVGGKLMGKMKKSGPMDSTAQIGLLKKWGTLMTQPMSMNSGDSPIKNWSGTPKDVKKHTKDFNPDKPIKLEVEKYHCYSCPMGCGGVLDIHDLFDGAFSHTHKPEYESVNQFGPQLLNYDYKAIFYVNELLNRAGIDTISCGGTVAFAIECYERGILTKEDTDGLELTWGNASAVIELVKKIIRREGIGDVLADGSKRAAERIGKGSEQYAIHVGGSEPGAHDSRNDPGLALHYEADPAPGKHTVGMDSLYNAMAIWNICSWAPVAKQHLKEEDYAVNDENALRTVAGACYTMLVDGIGMCLYGQNIGTGTIKVVDMINAASGWDLTGDDYMEMGKRIQTMRQMFNIKQGIDPRQVKLPKRMLGEPPLEHGPLKGKQLKDREKFKSCYWRLIGWDEETGVPLESSIEQLGIDKLLKMEVQ